MNDTTMKALLLSDEERVRNALKAGQSVDQDRDSGARILDEELGALLLRYNAAFVDDPERQAAADAMTATAREGLRLLGANRTTVKSTRRETRAGAPWLLLLAAALSAASAWLLTQKPPYFAAAGFALALLCAFLSGRLWTKPGQAAVENTLDTDILWQTLSLTAETIDRKTDELSSLARARREEAKAAERDKLPLGEKELELMEELLEALYTANGDYALLKLRRLRPYLKEKGLELVDYSADTAELFELMPSKNAAVTLRPAIVHEKKLLAAGRATAPLG